MKPEPLSRGTERARSYLHVADMLRQEITKMDVDASGRLPSERELAGLLNISRPSLREGLIALELQGEIEIRIGSGIYLKQPANPARTLEPAASGQVPAPMQAVKMGDSPRDVNQMRLFLEGGVAAHAARFITRPQLRQLEKSLQAMRAALRQKGRAGVRTITEADRLFHMTLAAVTENELLVQTLEDLFDQRYTPVANTMHQHFDDQSAWQVAVHEHQEIYEAIANRDPLQAQAAMQRHLTRAHARLMAVIG